MPTNRVQSAVDLAFLKGAAALEREEYKLAEVNFAQALHLDANNARAMIFLLYAQLKRRPTLRAIDGLQQALKLTSNDTLVLRTAAKVHVILDQAPKGMALLEKARSIDPNDAETQAELANGYLSLRERTKCEAAFTAALKLAPDNVLALLVKKSFAKVYFDAAPAQRAEEQTLRKTPETTESHTDQGKAAIAKGEVLEGYWHLREAVRLNPKSTVAREALTAALRQRFPLYDWFYRFSLHAMRWRVVTSFVLVFGIARLTALAVGGANLPIWAPPALIAVAALLVVLAALLLWPMRLITFALRYHPVGRYTLAKVDRAENLFGACTLAAGLVWLILCPVLKSPGLAIGGGIDIAFFAALVASTTLLRPPSTRGAVLVFMTLVWLPLNAIMIYGSCGGAGPGL